MIKNTIDSIKFEMFHKMNQGKKGHDTNDCYQDWKGDSSISKGDIKTNKTCKTFMPEIFKLRCDE